MCTCVCRSLSITPAGTGGQERQACGRERGGGPGCPREPAPAPACGPDSVVVTALCSRLSLVLYDVS